VIKKESKVTLNYKLTVDGEVVDSSEGKDPFTYNHGEGEIVPGLEEALEGMKEGEKKSISVPPEKGYGEANPDAMQKVPRAAFQGGGELAVGEMVLGQAGGHEFQAKIVALDDEEVTLDLNHPLAGKTLEFQVEIMAVS